MEVLGINGVKKWQSRSPGFWRRQFTGDANGAQLAFDIVFGIVGPILCFIFDPLVFRGDILGGPLLPDFRIFVYLLSGFEIVTLVLWLILGRSLPAKRLIGGILIAGGGFCLLIGCVLFPISMIGVFIYGVGLLGFTPFLTAIAYLRNGYQAIKSEKAEVVAVGRTAPVLLGCLLAIGAPALLSSAIHRVLTQSVYEIIQGDPQRVMAASATLKWLNPLTGTELDQIVNIYVAEQDPSRKELLRKSYQEITGDDIETKVRGRFMD